jgi:hypothetical protein
LRRNNSQATARAMSTKDRKVCGWVLYVALWVLLLLGLDGEMRLVAMILLTYAATICAFTNLAFRAIQSRCTAKGEVRTKSPSYEPLWIILVSWSGPLFLFQPWLAVGCFGVAAALYLFRRFLIRRAEQSYPSRDTSHDNAA